MWLGAVSSHMFPHEHDYTLLFFCSLLGAILGTLLKNGIWGGGGGCGDDEDGGGCW